MAKKGEQEYKNNTMDRKIEKKRWSTKRITALVVAVSLIALLSLTMKALNKKSFKVSREKIAVKEVVSGEFQDIILVEGSIEPIQQVLVNTSDGGAVEEILVEDGSLIKKGQTIVRLNNPTVMLGYMNQETAIIEQINNLRNLKLALEKDQRILAESLIDSDYELLEKERNFKIDSQLFKNNVIAEKEFEDILEAYKYQKKKNSFLLKNVNKTKEDNKIQIQQISRSIELMERNLDLIHSNMEKMKVKAPVDGQISSFDPVIGETYEANQTIAKIDVLEGYKVKAFVDEYYLSMVNKGLLARFSFNGKLVELEVKKVIPEVVNGRFKVELVFKEKAPDAITTGLNVQVRLELSQAKKAVLLPRGSYFQSSGGRFVFVLTSDNTAEKRMIKVGKNNPSYYEVIDGLEPGEKFISSSYANYKDFDYLEIK